MQPSNHTPDGPAPRFDSRGPDPVPAAQPVDLVIDGGQAVAWLAGDIDVSNSADILAVSALALADPRVDAVVLDVSQVSFFDSTGLGALVRLRNQAREAGKRLALRGITPPVSRVLSLTHLDEVFGLGVADAGRC